MLAVTHVEVDEVHAGLGQKVGHNLVCHPAMQIKFNAFKGTSL